MSLRFPAGASIGAGIDANGNTLSDASGKSYSWDFENRLVQAVVPGPNGGTTTFKYDPFGRRIQKSGPLGTTNYLYDGVNAIEEIDGSANVLARYTQGAGIDEPLAQLRSSATSYYDADGLGSITSLTNSTGAVANSYAFDTFGKQTTTTGTLTNPFQYTARESDSETGLYYYRARYYDANAGRFISEDPIQFLGGANFYRYAANDPVRKIDPWGLYTEVIIWNPVDSSGASQFGHTSVIINGTSYSWGPAPGKNPLNKCCKAGTMNQQPAQNYISSNTNFRSGIGYVLNLTTAQENAFANYLAKYKGNYNAITNNCDDPVASGLAGVGINLNFAPDPLGLGPILIFPYDLENALLNTNGLVTDWATHPKVGTGK